MGESRWLHIPFYLLNESIVITSNVISKGNRTYRSLLGEIKRETRVSRDIVNTNNSIECTHYQDL